MNDTLLPSLEIVQIPVLRDNYIYLLNDRATGATAVVDPALPEPVLEALSARRWSLTFIFNTHYHADHVGGNLALKAATGCTIIGQPDPEEVIPGLDRSVHDGDRVMLGASSLEVLSVPGHTQRHIAFWSKAIGAVFVGDTLFALGCGRLLGGSAVELWQSLEKLKRLPAETLVFCAHEYTESNGAFALTVDGANEALQKRMQVVHEARHQKLPTVPSRLLDELLTNPFLRVSDPTIRSGLGFASDVSDDEVFTRLRAMKDAFKAG